ncbi:MAG: flagellar motor switch protein FliM [candidate division Zixibacteria bacterium]|nr:flagellar motor switch protein FliM [candidate division Zixibacteria bacterium]
MAKILSQDEIDALLTSVAPGDEEGDVEIEEEEIARSIVAYDFKHPNRVSKDQIRTLENIHDSFAGHLGSSLSTIQRAMVDVELVSVDQITYSEFIMSLLNPSCTYTISMDPLEGACIIDFSPPVCFLFIDRMFGGMGKPAETDRELTGIEKSVMNRIATKVFTELEVAWEQIISMNMKQVGFETNPQFLQIVPPGETVIVISFNLKMLGSSGLVTICYPYVTLEPIVEKLSAQHWIDAGKQRSVEEDYHTNSDALKDVEADLTAVMGRTTLRMRDFLKLKAGDVIPMDQSIHDDILIKVGNKYKYLGKPGIANKLMAVQITSDYKV